MDFKWNNLKPACCAKWLVLPTVYSDSLSYGEQLDKFCYQLNQLIENNNILPDFIAEMIKEYINSGAIGEVVRDILGDYILNVKYPPEGITPAAGDGSADDTAAIQGCIDYAAENGGVVYFPYGSYLTQPITMKDGVSLFGFDRYSTKIVLKGGATKPLIGGTVTDLSIANLTLDGNSGIQVNDVNVVTIMGTNVLFTNLIIKDGYTLVNYVGTGGHFQISDVVFGNAVEKCLFTSGNADVQCENVVFNQLSAVGGISVMDIGTDGGFYNVKSVAKCNKCIVVGGNKNKISAIVENASIPVVDNGLQNNVEIFGVSNKEYYSGNTEKEVGGNYSKRVAGAYTKAIDGNSNDSVGGNYSKIVTGVTTETYNGNKTVNGVNETKILSGKRTVSSNVYDETVTGNKNVSVGSLEENVSETKTINANNVEETVTQDKNITANNVTETVAETKTINANDLELNIVEPLGYKEPQKLNEYFDFVEFKHGGKPYRVLVSGSKNIEALNANLADGSDIGIFGEYAVNEYNECFSEGMCIGNGNMYSFGADVASDSDGASKSICNITDLNTGLTRTEALPLVGHYNDATFYNDCVIAVVNQNTIIFLDPENVSELNRVNVEYSVYQIAYDNLNNKIVIANSSYLFIYNIDGYNLTHDRTIKITQPYTTQGMCCHNGLIFFSSYITPDYYGGTSADNYGALINVYTINGELIHTYILGCGYGELEGIDILDGYIILMYQRISSDNDTVWCYYRTPLYKNTNKFVEDMFLSRISQPSLTIYVNKDYKNFYVDGTQEKPFVSLENATLFACKVDARETYINVTGKHGGISVNNGHGLIVYTGGQVRSFVSLRNSGEIRLINMTVGYEGINRTGIISLCNLTLRGCTVYGETNCVEIQGGVLTINVTPCVFNGTRAINANFGATVVIAVGGNTFNGDYGFGLTDSYCYSIQQGVKYATSGLAKIQFLGERIDFGSSSFTCGANSSVEVVVSYVNEFTFNPTIMLNTRVTTSGLQNITTYIKESTKTGFTAVVCNHTENVLTNQTLYWTALAR